MQFDDVQIEKKHAVCFELFTLRHIRKIIFTPQFMI